jgi:hypothetical protein
LVSRSPFASFSRRQQIQFGRLASVWGKHPMVASLLLRFFDWMLRIAWAAPVPEQRDAALFSCAWHKKETPGLVPKVSLFNL